MARHVYRRPYFRQARNKLPLTRRLHAWFLTQRRRRHVARRRVRVVRRLPHVFGVAAVVAAGAGQVLVRLRRLPKQSRALRRVRRVPPPATSAHDALPGLVRFWLAIKRQRRDMYRRLRRRPVPRLLVVEETQGPVGEQSVIKGRISQPGLVRGRITTGGI